MNLPVLPLHHNPEYKIQCCELINKEWKRSETARLRSLESSCDNLPTCLVLIENDKVVGHCKLTAIPSIKDACFVESVVIDATLRGQGYGTYLMSKAEDYCKDVLKLNVIYLSTKGQEVFYEKLGYKECEPVSIYGSCISTEDNNYKNNIIYINRKLHDTKLSNDKVNKLTRKTYMCKEI